MSTYPIEGAFRQVGFMTWAGRLLSALVVLFLAVDGLTGILSPEKLRQTSEETGFAFDLLGTVGWIALVCAIVYAFPRTALLGAILVTGFCGGAICTHVRIGEFASPPQIVCVVLAIAAWGGLWLRDPRLRSLLPITTA